MVQVVQTYEVAWISNTAKEKKRYSPMVIVRHLAAMSYTYTS